MSESVILDIVQRRLAHGLYGGGWYATPSDAFSATEMEGTAVLAFARQLIGESGTMLGWSATGSGPRDCRLSIIADSPRSVVVEFVNDRLVCAWSEDAGASRQNRCDAISEVVTMFGVVQALRYVHSGVLTAELLQQVRDGAPMEWLLAHGESQL